ncbi:MAG: hypothetical protein N3F10_03530 [Candidatus Bathyarchaeota archaeon]|nr:hypothetical protein [Candidatus Bathyarchaeota archaeon]MCX8177351.1 hypothetical protein [Candidatus Bathyarchaeota archaeon]MDW8193797.1 hypothetical protein [Nitrososphaerota archaeon]
MSLERERLEKLIEKIDDLLVVLNSVAEDLRTVSTSLKSIAVSQIAPTPISALPAPAREVEAGKEVSVGDVKKVFPEDLEPLLNFEDKGEYIMIKPRQFLGSENFARIASIIREVGGEYISAGKESHFRIPKKKF